jgi:hypothetical protein
MQEPTVTPHSDTGLWDTGCKRSNTSSFIPYHDPRASLDERPSCPANRNTLLRSTMDVYFPGSCPAMKRKIIGSALVEAKRGTWASPARAYACAGACDARA